LEPSDVRFTEFLPARRVSSRIFYPADGGTVETPTSPMGKIKARPRDTKEIRIKLAIQTFNNKPSPLSIRCAAAKYAIPRTTLQTRLKEVRSRSASQAEKEILTPDEEKDIARCIEILDDRAIPPRAIDVYKW
jgi:hypothetical protein